MPPQTVSGAVAARDRSTQLVSWIRGQQDDIAMAAASHIKPSAIVRVTQGALRRNDKLLAAAIANPQSLLYALLDCARLGHEPDTDEYYLVPFGNEVTGIEGYKGIIERMYRAGGVSAVVAQVVRRADRYAPRGENTPPLHEYDDFASAEERGPMRGAYAYAIFPAGRCSQVIRMGRAEIMEHKAKSRGSDKPDSPWQQWEPAMWKKTVLRALEPYVPTSAEYRSQNNMAAATLTSVADRPADFTYAVPPASGPPAHGILRAEVIEEPAAESPSNEGPKQEPRGGEPENKPDAPAGDAAPEVPARASSGQVSIIGRLLKQRGFGDDERLGVITRLAGRDLGSAAELTQDEAAHIKTLLADKCPDRAAVIELLATGQVDHGGEAP